MRRTLLWIPVLALLGCGAHSSLEVGGSSTGSTTSTTSTTGTGGGTTTSAGYLQTSCAPTDGPAVGLFLLGASTCPPVTGTPSGLELNIWGPDLASLQSGSATLVVGTGVNAPTTGYRVIQSGTSVTTVQMNGGTLVFDSYVSGVSGSGTYDVTFEDGTSAQGSFQVPWCPGGGQCG